MKKTALLVSIVSLLLVGCGEEQKSTTEKTTKNTEVIKQESTKKELPVVKKEVEVVKKKVETVKKKEAVQEIKKENTQKREVKASASKGQKIFAKKLKKVCGMNGGAFAKKHTQDEWSKIEKEGKFKSEIKSICKDVDLSQVKDKYIPDLFEFMKQFASDSGNVPSC